MAFFTDTHSATPALFDRLSTAFAKFLHARAEAREFRRTYEELSKLSDRDLDDLGLTRWELGAVVRQTVYGK